MQEAMALRRDLPPRPLPPPLPPPRGRRFPGKPLPRPWVHSGNELWSHRILWNSTHYVNESKKQGGQQNDMVPA